MSFYSYSLPGDDQKHRAKGPEPNSRHSHPFRSEAATMDDAEAEELWIVNTRRKEQKKLGAWWSKPMPPEGRVVEQAWQGEVEVPAAFAGSSSSSSASTEESSSQQPLPVGPQQDWDPQTRSQDVSVHTVYASGQLFGDMQKQKAEEEASSLRKENRLLEARLAASRVESDHWRQQLTSKNDTVASLELTVEKLSIECNDLKLRLSALEEENETLKGKLDQVSVAATPPPEPAAVATPAPPLPPSPLDGLSQLNTTVANLTQAVAAFQKINLQTSNSVTVGSQHPTSPPTPIREKDAEARDWRTALRLEETMSQLLHALQERTTPKMESRIRALPLSPMLSASQHRLTHHQLAGSPPLGVSVSPSTHDASPREEDLHNVSHRSDASIETYSRRISPLPSQVATQIFERAVAAAQASAIAAPEGPPPPNALKAPEAAEVVGTPAFQGTIESSKKSKRQRKNRRSASSSSATDSQLTSSTGSSVKRHSHRRSRHRHRNHRSHHRQFSRSSHRRRSPSSDSGSQTPPPPTNPPPQAALSATTMGSSQTMQQPQEQQPQLQLQQPQAQQQQAQQPQLQARLSASQFTQAQQPPAQQARQPQLRAQPQPQATLPASKFSSLPAQQPQEALSLQRSQLQPQPEPAILPSRQDTMPVVQSERHVMAPFAAAKYTGPSNDLFSVPTEVFVDVEQSTSGPPPPPSVPPVAQPVNEGRASSRFRISSMGPQNSSQGQSSPSVSPARDAKRRDPQRMEQLSAVEHLGVQTQHGEPAAARPLSQSPLRQSTNIIVPASLSPPRSDAVSDTEMKPVLELARQTGRGAGKRWNPRFDF